jgi:hypothetical protein
MHRRLANIRNHYRDTTQVGEETSFAKLIRDGLHPLYAQRSAMRAKLRGQDARSGRATP